MARGIRLSFVEPDWLVGLQANAWRKIPNSAMNLSPPSVTQLAALAGSGASCIMDNWNGFGLDTRNNMVHSIGNGGHGDWYGNENFRFDLNADAPSWVEWLAATLYAQDFVDAGKPAQPRHYADSTRLSGQHSYYNHQMLERQNRIVRVYSGSVSSGPGTGFGTMDGFDCNAAQGVNGTDPDLTYPIVDGASSPYHFNTHGPATCKDPDTEELYVFKDNGVCRKFTPNASSPGGSWANAGGSPPAGFTGFLAAAAFDSSRKRIFVAKGWVAGPPYGNTRYFYFNTLNNTYTEVTSSMSGAALAALDAAMSSVGMVYEPDLDAYLIRLGEMTGHTQTRVADRVIKVDASTWEVSLLSTSGGSLISQTADVNGGTDQYENVYNKWLRVPSLRGIAFFPRYTSDAWFLRTR